MRILFLTASLEPGQDGVGDYTRRLALSCSSQGHDVALIALHDPHVSEPKETAETHGDRPLPVLRLPVQLPWRKRIELASAFRARHPCDWISLQFVAYAFDPKGIVKGLAGSLLPLIAGCPLHLMFHELWIGVGPLAPFRHRLVGRVQRYYIEQLIRRLSPQVITTTIALYRILLEDIGWSAAELPLFGNIPVAPVLEPQVPSFSQALFFGSLYPEWKPEPFMRIWIAAAAKRQQQPCLLSVGRLGAAGEGMWRKLHTDYAGRVDFITLGELPSPVVSSWLQLTDFGLAASPWHLIGKSGSTAAMLDHGLPVIVTREEFPDAPVSSIPSDPLLHLCDAALETKLVSGLAKRAPHERVDDIVLDFIRLLAASGKERPS